MSEREGRSTMKKTSKMAVASFVLSVIALICIVGAGMLKSVFLENLSLCFPILAVVLGLVARHKIRKSKNSFAGSGMALSSVIVGWLLIAAIPLYAQFEYHRCGFTRGNDTFEVETRS